MIFTSTVLWRITMPSRLILRRVAPVLFLLIVGLDSRQTRADYDWLPQISTSGPSIELTGLFSWTPGVDTAPQYMTIDRYKWNGSAYAHQASINEPGFKPPDTVNGVMEVDDTHNAGSYGTFKYRVRFWNGTSLLLDKYTDPVTISPP
jgi:hypothetical protein